MTKKFFIPRENINILNDILKNLIEKCFSSSKNHLKDKSKDAIIKGVENLSNTDTLCENIINLFNTKNQKLIQSGILISLLNLFGSSALNYKILSPKFLKFTEQCSPLIKNDIISFITELYKWIRGGIRQYLNNTIKDSVKQDIEKSMEDNNNQFKNGLNMIPKIIYIVILNIVWIKIKMIQHENLEILFETSFKKTIDSYFNNFKYENLMKELIEELGLRRCKNNDK